MQNSYYASRVSRYLGQAAASFAAKRYRDCIRQANEAERFDKANPQTYCWRIVGNLRLGNVIEARRISEHALEKFPDHAPVQILAGEILTELGSYEEARVMLEGAIAADPSIWTAWSNYASVLYCLQDYHAAKGAALKALELEPGNPGILSNYANTLKETGEVAEAVAVLREAVKAAPTVENIRFNLLFTMLFDEATTAAALLREAQACAALLAGPGGGSKPLATPTDTGRIRLGLLSNDLFAHACAYFIIPFLANIDHTRIEVFVFTLNGRKDNVTQKILHYAEHFIDLSGESPDKTVERIRESRLDVLVDMGGYTRNSPLRYMAHRLAPNQMTWMGYPGSTGMPQIDYRLTDGVTDPNGYEAHHVEKLMRAPVVSAVYYPLVGRPLHAYAGAYRTGATPAIANGHITFGCCINLGKISTRTLRLWSAVLARCAGSKLLLECAGLDHDAVRLPLLHRMAQAGMDPERVICVPRRAENQYLMYNNIDIVLDTSPMTGGTNACDALWMGVPIITLTGNASHERIATSVLASIGLARLACESEDQYVETAVKLASDVAGLNSLRMSIRPMFEASALFDAAAFCRWFESEIAGWVAAYRQPGVLPKPAGDGVFFGGRWHTMEEIILSVVDALTSGNIDGLVNVLENISAKWSKHWLVAFALAEISYLQHDRQEALDLLIESAMLRKYSLPLYRLLIARLDECGQDKSELAAFLQEAFGVDIAFLEMQPLPSVFEIAGVPVQAEEVAA